jgi:preprotein translocase subunit SecY
LSRSDLYSTSLMDFHRGWRRQADSLSETTKLLLLFGTYVNNTFGPRYYGKAVNISRRLTAAYDAVLKDYDLLLLPTTIASFNAGKGPEWFQWLTTQLSHGRPLFLVLYLAMIVFFAFFYTAIVFNPTETADNLKKHGGFIPGIRPGERTAEYIDYVLSRITVIGAIYLAVVCLIPEILISYASVPFYLGGTSLLIVVSVTMDTVAQVQGYLLAHQYEGLIRKPKLRARRK